MEGKGSEDRKSEQKSEEVDSDKKESNDEMDLPESTTGKKEIPKQETRSTTDAKTEKSSQELETKNPQPEVNIERRDRKRRAPPLDVTDPKKPSLSVETKPTPSDVHLASGTRKRQASPAVVAEPKKLALHPETAPAPAEADAPDVLMHDFQNLHINRTELLVHRERSGYVNAQAAFHVPEEAEPCETSEGAAGGSGEGAAGGSGEGAAGGSGEGAAGGSGEGAAGGSGEGGAGGSRESFPRLIIPIYWIQDMYAGVVSKYNETIPKVEEELAHYRNIVQALRDYEDQTGGGYYMVLFTASPHVRNLMEAESCKRERIRVALEENIPRVEAEMNKCTRIAETVMEIFSADETSPMPAHSDESPCKFLRELDNSLTLLDSFRDLCNNLSNEYNKQRYSMNEEIPWTWI